MRTQGKHRYTSVNQALLSSLSSALRERLLPARRPQVLRAHD